MKKEILKLFYLPIFLFIFVSFIYFGMIYFFVNKHVKENNLLIQKMIINETKNNIKSDIKKTKEFLKILKNTLYSYTEFELEELVRLIIKYKLNKLYIDDTFIFGLLPKNKKFKYKIYNNRFILLNLNKAKYIVVLGNKGKKIYIFGIRKKYIDTFLFSKFIQYLNQINRDTQSYIALEKIITLNPKNNIYGYIYYMPLEFANLIGNDLYINKTDANGFLYRKKYLKCFKEGKGCFVDIKTFNPKNEKIENMLIYYDFIKEYNLSIYKAVYENVILNKIRKKIKHEEKSAFLIFKISVVVYFIIIVLFVLLEHIVLGKLKNKLIKEYEDIIDELKRKTYYDNVTGLFNRVKLLEDINNYHSLILMDINDFSTINEIYGFKEGDKILSLIGIYLKNKYENVYKIGSDEFAICLKKKVTKEFLENFVNTTFEIDGIEINFVIGASNCRENLFKTAEMALKLAVKSKNKKYVLYDTNMFFEQKKKLKKINILKSILQKENIIPYYQCIVNKNGEIVKYESLMRVKINKEIKNPSYFLDIVKEAKIYDDFSLIMIKKVFEDVKKIDKKISINLSFEDINNKEIRNFIIESLNDRNASKIVFEILESESIQNYEIVKDFILKVKKKGAEIAIDDFGSGYSNFVQVLNLEPDIIKIDASLIKDIKNPKNYKMVTLIVDFAKSFNLKTIAEYVSDKEIFEIVKDLGIDEFQGFYFCKPKPFENILKKDKISPKKGNNEN